MDNHIEIFYHIKFGWGWQELTYGGDFVQGIWLF